ncbi:MAG: ABC transporter ATP-binding protein [Euryarchaeota archaeon]|nr:ABC transporter ATP-binding protein [Euryarchaeota archaeon]
MSEPGGTPGVILEARGLTKVYGGRAAVDHLDLVIPRGDVFGFLGPNGAGKTTTIGMVTGLVSPSEGEARVLGVDVTRDPMQAKRITGYLPEAVGFYGHLTGERNLDYFARFYGLPAGERERRIGALLEFVGLKGVETRVEGYSKGMKQRLGIAQALLNDPELLILDEPTSGLDPEGTAQVRDILRVLNQDLGKTIFFSSHILSEVRQVCKTVGVLFRGKLLVLGSPGEIHRKMRGDRGLQISVESNRPLPDLEIPGLRNIRREGNRAVVEVEWDAREEIAAQLFRKGYPLRELRLVEPSLEEMFLELVRRGEAVEEQGPPPPAPKARAGT